MVSTRDRLRPDAEQVDELPLGDYANRPPLADGTLVYGLERSAMDEARAWLASRYARSAKPAQGDQPAAPDGAAPPSQPAPVPAAGVQQLTLDNGALLFTNSGSN